MVEEIIYFPDECVVGNTTGTKIIHQGESEQIVQPDSGKSEYCAD